MSWSLAPSRGSSFFPGFSGFPRWTDIERDIDRDISRMYRMFSDVSQHVLPDREGVHHRQPNYTYEETHQQADIEVELPGVAKENVSIDLTADTLSISAKRYRNPQMQPSKNIPVEGQAQENGGKTDTQITQDDEIQKQKHTATAEEPSLSVHYQLNLPIGNKFDAERITATMLGDGILTMVVPKKTEHAGPSRMIQIGSP